MPKQTQALHINLIAFFVVYLFCYDQIPTLQYRTEDGCLPRRNTLIPMQKMEGNVSDG